MKARVDVILKPSVLDPQGKAVEHALTMLGFPGISNVRVGKVVMFDLATANAADAEAQARAMAEKLLVNPIIEDFTVHVES